MTMDELLKTMQNLFRDVFGDASIELQNGMTAADIDGWDSLMHINLIIAVEKQFGIRCATAEISGLKSEDQNVGTFLRLIATKVARK